MVDRHHTQIYDQHMPLNKRSRVIALVIINLVLLAALLTALDLYVIPQSIQNN